MKLIIDENISFAEEAFSQFGEIHLYNGREITNEILSDADVLLVRSITNVNGDLLKGTKVKFVGTATIGTDHIDLQYLQKENIRFAFAPGCNSWAVTEYVYSAISHFIYQNKIGLTDKSFGIVGIGNIGKKVSRIAEQIGFDVKRNDPPRQEAEGLDFNSLSEALDSDFITFHVPINKTGKYPTFHLLGENIGLIKPDSFVINSSRGPVVDNQKLLENYKRQNLTYVLDVWENEPQYIPELLSNSFVGTPHIAGYSFEGKVNGTTMLYNQLCEFLDVKSTWEPKLPKVDDNEIEYSGDSVEELLYTIFRKSYLIFEDSNRLKKALNLPEHERGKHFDKLRKEYPFRRELNNYKAVIKKGNEQFNKILNAFRIETILR
ncbi:MAG: 4-phosphoerythronate dehydrogenase [Melioribacteraceae bacterium]|nr:4-phosphoerythronate dehydrogenase [Melioribacteraceae bacterium]MCF8263208.1 4-phosphoerythronate dehydrogenase [Melioribacteraceae bacterium]MCF8412719.1 4-phosphoerythronate dehydrogenase [Melioribacteraceae bacterium]